MKITRRRTQPLGRRSKQHKLITQQPRRDTARLRKALNDARETILTFSASDIGLRSLIFCPKAPLASNRSTHSGCLYLLALSSGVFPYIFTSFTLAPLEISNCKHFGSPSSHVQWAAVIPNLFAALRSAPLSLRSARHFT